MKQKRKKNYVNNSDFYDAIVEYQEVLANIHDEKDYPKIPEYVATCVYSICTRIAKKSNFKNYSYIDEMISDGLENALASIEKFDPQKSRNPFAYFTQIIINAFIRRIKLEQKHSYIKHASLENIGMQLMLETNGEIQYLVENEKEYTDNHANFLGDKNEQQE